MCQPYQKLYLGLSILIRHVHAGQVQPEDVPVKAVIVDLFDG